jgi:glutamyl-Q tRNA(Asp) synthetase
MPRLPSPSPVTRFAPSPTGYLHLGHVANAVWTWGVAGASGGAVLLRIEDHDRGRCRPDFEARIIEDLAWLGLEPDIGSRASLLAGSSPYRQSDSTSAYEAALARLSSLGLIYGCDCSRSTIARELGDGVLEGQELRYPGICRDRGLAPGPGVGVRVRLPDSEECFTDLRLGEQRQRPQQQCGDLLIRDKAGNWTYQYAVTVDDHRHGVTLVVRGEDLLSSTGRQLLLARLLGRPEATRFLHHPLIMNPAGIKLSKKDHATGLAELRSRGMTASQVVGEAAWRTGLLPRFRPLTPPELPDLFRPAAA